MRSFGNCFCIFLVFLHLTSTNGSPVYIAAANVSAVRHPIEGDCKCAHAVVVTGNGTFAVKETMEEIVQQLEKAK